MPDQRMACPLAELERHEGDWLSVAAPPAAPQYLAVSAKGYRASVLPAPSPSRRHEVILQPALATSVRFSDASSGLVVGGIAIRASRSPLPQPHWPGRSLPGMQPESAIYHARAEASGVAEFDHVEPGVMLVFDISHPHYVLAREAPPTIASGSQTVIPVQIPFVGAIRYSGDEIVNGSTGCAQPTITNPTTLGCLDALRHRLAGDRDDTLAIAVLPATGRGSLPPIARAQVVLRRQGVRSDTLKLVPLDEYEGPQVVESSPAADVTALARVRILRPAPWVEGRHHDFRVAVTGRHAPTVISATGASVELPLGRYTVGAAEPGMRGAIVPAVLDLRETVDVDLQLEWDPRTHCYLAAVSCDRPARIVQFQYEHDNIKYVTDGVFNDGRVVFWSHRELRDVVVYMEHHVPSDMVFARIPGTELFEGSCVLVSRPEAATNR